MSKTLCKLKKKERAKKQLNVADPGAQFVCKKCGRAADKKKRLCKPTALKLVRNSD